MSTTVVIPATMSSNGLSHTYSDDSDPNTGLDAGGHVDRLVPMILDTVYVANYALTQAGLATTNGAAQVALATAQVGLATNIATTVAQSPSTSATSTTSLTISIASKSLTLAEFGKSYSVGQTINISTQNGENVMSGIITAFVTANGVMTVNILKVIGSGTFASWIISLGAMGGGTNATTRQVYVATAAQTNFAAAYEIGFVDVYLNGAKLVVTTDFTATSGTGIVLAIGAAAGDIVDIVAYGAFSVANTYTVAQADTLLTNKQATLVNQTNIKSLNGASILGSGDLQVQGTPDFILINAGII